MITYFPLLHVEAYCRNGTIAQNLDVCRSLGGLYPDVQAIYPRLFEVTIVLDTVVLILYNRIISFPCLPTTETPQRAASFRGTRNWWGWPRWARLARRPSQCRRRVIVVVVVPCGPAWHAALHCGNGLAFCARIRSGGICRKKAAFSKPHEFPN